MPVICSFAGVLAGNESQSSRVRRFVDVVDDLVVADQDVGLDAEEREGAAVRRGRARSTEKAA